MRPESIEFFALLEAAGWSQAEAARRLEISPGVLSQYKRKIAPSAQTLKLLKLMLASERPGALSAAMVANEEALSEWERKVIEDLRWLHVEDREKVLNVMRTMIRDFPRREAVDYGKVQQTALKGAKTAVERIKNKRN